ncbi:hypothetical protein GOV07_04610 [Candidatus Woesearchaeota archaeon]|nr:hypothetical protein [Candidatus Woesearchaeota archaeon]
MKQRQAKRQTWRSRLGLLKLIENETSMTSLDEVAKTFLAESDTGVLRRCPFNFNGNMYAREITTEQQLVNALLHGNLPHLFAVEANRSVYVIGERRIVYVDITVYNRAIKRPYYSGIFQYTMRAEPQESAEVIPMPILAQHQEAS